MQPASKTQNLSELPGLRWWIVAMLFLAAVLNYADKNALALLAPTIQKDLGFGDVAYANIQNAFQIAYTIALLCTGIFVDKLGPRISLGIFVAWWSLANILTGFARSVPFFASFRFLLGLGEAGNWIASPKVVSKCFPAKERALAVGIYTAGTPVGMTLAPILIISLSDTFGWRSAFVLTGFLGLLWLLPWLVLFREAKGYTSRIENEQEEMPSLKHPEDFAIPSEKEWTWLQAFSHAEVWCLLFGRMLTDPIWFFYQNWYPKYLVSARGFTQADIKITWVIFLFAGLGSLLGGWISGQFIKRGFAVRRVRLYTMLGCALFMPLSPFVALVSSSPWSLALASIIVSAHLAWLVNISALVIDVVPGRSLGRVFGIVAAGSSLGAIMMNDLVAKLVTSDSYTNWFVIAAFPHLLVIPFLMWGILRRSPDAD